MLPKSIRQLLLNPPKSATVCGWIRTKRTHKSFCFLEINDGSSLVSLQAVAPLELADSITTGCSVEIQGDLVHSIGSKQGIELNAKKLSLLGSVEADYPLQKTKLDFNHLRNHQEFRSRSKTFGALWRLRHGAMVN